MSVCFILTAGLLYCQLKEFDIRQSDAPAALATIQRDFPNSVCLTIYSSIPNLRFESNMNGIEGERSRPEEGKYLVYLKPMKQLITVKALDYKESLISIPAGLKAKESIYYNIEPKAVSLKTEKGSFTLNSYPSGADIRIDGIPTFKEKTPYTFESFAAMTYKITLSKQRYETLETTITIDKDRALSKTVELKPQWADLKISSEPTGSEVYLQNKLIGRTPLDLSGVQAGLDPGEYQIELRALSEFYAPVKQSVKLKAGELTDLNLNHRDISGYLRTIPSHRPVNITMDNRPVPELERGESIRLLARKYIIKADYLGEHKNAFQPFTAEAELKAGEHKDLPLAFQPKQGTIRIKSNENGVSYSLYDMETGKTYEWIGEKTPPTIYAGAYKLTATKQGFKKINRDIDFQGGSYPLELNLISLDALYNGKIKFWSFNKYSVGSVSLASLIATGVLYSLAQSYYNEYQKTPSSAAAADFKQATKTAMTLTYACVGVDVIGIGWTVHSYLKQRKWKQAMLEEMEK